RVARQRAGAFARSPVAVVQSEPHFGVEDTGSEILVTRATHIFCHADAELPEKSWSNSQSFAIQINYLIGPERVPFVVACTGTKQTTSTDGRILPDGFSDDLMV